MGARTTGVGGRTSAARRRLPAASGRWSSPTGCARRPRSSGATRGRAGTCRAAGRSLVGRHGPRRPRRAAPVLRGRAPGPGDVVAGAGRLGWAAAGLAVLVAGLPLAAALVEAYRHPAAALLRRARAAARAGATAMIDVSDGLLADARPRGAGRGVVVDLDPAALRRQIPPTPAGRRGGRDQHRPPRRGCSAAATTTPCCATLPAGGVTARRVPGDRPGGGAGTPGAVGGGVPWAGTAGSATTSAERIAADRIAAGRPPGSRKAGRRRGPAFGDGWQRSGAGDLAGLEAGGADVEPLGRAADEGAHALDVRVPAARCGGGSAR